MVVINLLFKCAAQFLIEEINLHVSKHTKLSSAGKLLLCTCFFQSLATSYYTRGSVLSS